jgi:predicted nuclease with TOPRIM domain
MFAIALDILLLQIIDDKLLSVFSKEALVVIGLLVTAIGYQTRQLSLKNKVISKFDEKVADTIKLSENLIELSHKSSSIQSSIEELKTYFKEANQISKEIKETLDSKFDRIEDKIQNLK